MAGMYEYALFETLRVRGHILLAKLERRLAFTDTDAAQGLETLHG